MKSSSRCFVFFCQFYLLVWVSCQYHHMLFSYDSFILHGIDRKSGSWKYHLPEFCLISGDCGELGRRNLARMSLIKCYWILQNARVTASTVSELLREYQQGVGSKTTHQPRLGLKAEGHCLQHLGVTYICCDNMQSHHDFPEVSLFLLLQNFHKFPENALLRVHLRVWEFLLEFFQSPNKEHMQITCSVT